MQRLRKTLSDPANIGNYLFYLGIIFLPSAVPIGGLFLIIALIISILKTKTAIFKDKWNYPLFIATGLIISSCFKNTISPTVPNSLEFEVSSIWFSIFNWIPLFLCFWGFQEFLKNKNQRTIFAYALLIGTFPVIISCIAQNWFDLYGPFKTLNGLIIWFQKPLNPEVGISGLFSNPNYAGFWLSSIFPFAIAIFLKKIKYNLLNFILFLNSFIIFYLAILTNSRNTLIALISSFPFLISIKYFLLIIILFIFSVPAYIYLIPSIEEIMGFELKIIPQKLIKKLFFNEFGEIKNYPRLEIYSKTIKFIIEKPLLGWGASSFGFIYILNKGITNAQHTHNLSLQIAYDYGLPASVLLSSTIFLIFTLSFRKIIYSKIEDNYYIDKALLASSFVTISFHLSDIPYYDARASILIWTLLSGLKCILDEYKNT